MANKVLGMHRLKNKVNRNAFDLSHRHMFTAQVGELLPVFTQWVNPNETFKIGYNGKTRTAALNTDAFTRIRENIQYYFVPFQSLWKYFEQQVNNLTKGDAGQNISKFASSSTEASSITTSLPYISYVDLGYWLNLMYSHAVDAVNAYFAANTSSRSASAFKTYCSSSSTYSDVFFCEWCVVVEIVFSMSCTSVPPVKTFKACMPRQMPRIGLCVVSACSTIKRSSASRSGQVLPHRGWRFSP